MSKESLKKRLFGLENKVINAAPTYQVIRYDHKVGKPDRSTLPEASVYLFLPKKDPYPN